MISVTGWQRCADYGLRRSIKWFKAYLYSALRVQIHARGCAKTLVILIKTVYNTDNNEIWELVLQAERKV